MFWCLEVNLWRCLPSMPLKRPGNTRPKKGLLWYNGYWFPGWEISIEGVTLRFPLASGYLEFLKLSRTTEVTKNFVRGIPPAFPLSEDEDVGPLLPQKGTNHDMTWTRTVKLPMSCRYIVKYIVYSTHYKNHQLLSLQFLDFLIRLFDFNLKGLDFNLKGLDFNLKGLDFNLKGLDRSW